MGKKLNYRNRVNSELFSNSTAYQIKYVTDESKQIIQLQCMENSILATKGNILELFLMM